MIFDPFPVFLPSQYHVKFATEAWERQAAAALRRAVFCEEQRVFAADDRDGIDDIAIPIVAISSLAVALDDVVGTVRIHEAEPGVWWGSRLAVAAAYRRIGALGASLVPPAAAGRHAEAGVLGGDGEPRAPPHARLRFVNAHGADDVVGRDAQRGDHDQRDRDGVD